MKRLRLLLLSSLALLPSCGEKQQEESSTGTTPAAQPTGAPAPAAPAALEKKDGMVRLPGGTYTMGHNGSFQTAYGEKEFPEEGPEHEVTVKPFWIDETEVTNAQFAAFVKATGYLTFAERAVRVEDFPAEAQASLPAGDLFNGAIVFRDDAHGNPYVPGGSPEVWRWDPRANWLQPRRRGQLDRGQGEPPGGLRDP